MNCFPDGPTSDPRDWLRGGGDLELSAQTLRQADGHVIMLLRVETETQADEGRCAATSQHRLLMQR
jgi:hypothetical protein